MGQNLWHDSVPSDKEFSELNAPLRQQMGLDGTLRSQALSLIESSRQYNYSYHLKWLGVPIIRMAEDLVRQQEIIFDLRPEVIIEIGVARGGGLLFNASMQEILGMEPRVLGVDNRIFPHAWEAIKRSRYAEQISLLEADSDSTSATNFVAAALKDCSAALLILDSDHSSKHVLSELRAYFNLLPVGSVIMVCDTIIDEFPAGTFPNRSWSNGKGPGHAVKEFLTETPHAEIMDNQTADLLITEIRGGVIRKNSH